MNKQHLFEILSHYDESELLRKVYEIADYHDFAPVLNVFEQILDDEAEYQREEKAQINAFFLNNKPRG